MPGGSRGRDAGGGERDRRHRPQALVSRRDRCRRGADRVEGHAAQDRRRGRVGGPPEGGLRDRGPRAAGDGSADRRARRDAVPRAGGLGAGRIVGPGGGRGRRPRPRPGRGCSTGTGSRGSRAKPTGGRATRRPVCGRATRPSAAGSWPFTRRRRGGGWKPWRSTRRASRSRSCWSTPARPLLAGAGPVAAIASVASARSRRSSRGPLRGPDRSLGRGVGGPPRRRSRLAGARGRTHRRGRAGGGRRRPGSAGPGRAGSWRCGPLPASAGRGVGRPWWRRRRRPACGSSRPGWTFGGSTWSEAGPWPAGTSPGSRARTSGL